MTTLTASVLRHYLELEPQKKETCLATYLWVDGSGENIRGKTKTLPQRPNAVQDLPVWNFDGSSTGQSVGMNSDVYLHPVAFYPDPFFLGNSILVMCATYGPKGEPTVGNHRDSCYIVMKKAASTKPWFGFEQEYTILDTDGHPLGWPKNGFPAPQGPYYCGVGANKVFGRQLMDAHCKACLYAGLDISGTNVEVMPSQFEYQIGPCEGVSLGDQVWISRYILHRLAEELGVVVTLDPKPMPEWNGAGAHCNFSTEEMRNEGGIKHIKEAIDELSKFHNVHIKYYDPKRGEDNKRRLTGLHETSSIYDFSSGVANREASIRIPRQVNKDGRGYLEDRRPAANCDPYEVTEVLVRTIVLQDWEEDEVVDCSDDSVSQ